MAKPKFLNSQIWAQAGWTSRNS